MLSFLDEKIGDMNSDFSHSRSPAKLPKTPIGFDLPQEDFVAGEVFPISEQSFAQFQFAGSESLKWLFERAKKSFFENDRETAKPIFQKIISLTRSDLELQIFCHLCLAKIYFNEEDVQKLKHHGLLAIALDPDRSELRFDLGRALSVLGKDREAAAAFRAAWERSPSNVTYQLCFARSLGKIGRFREAQETFQKALVKEPRHRDLLHQYALFLLDHHCVSDAKDYLKRALEIAPDDKEIMRTFSLLKLLDKKEEGMDEEFSFGDHSEEKPAPAPVSDANKARRMHMDGFSFVFAGDTHWVDDSDRAEEYQEYVKKNPEPKLGFLAWRSFDDEYLQLLFNQTVRELSAAENKRIDELQALLLY